MIPVLPRFFQKEDIEKSCEAMRALPEKVKTIGQKQKALLDQRASRAFYLDCLEKDTIKPLQLEIIVLLDQKIKLLLKNLDAVIEKQKPLKKNILRINNFLANQAKRTQTQLSINKTKQALDLYKANRLRLQQGYEKQAKEYDELIQKNKITLDREYRELDRINDLLAASVEVETDNIVNYRRDLRDHEIESQNLLEEASSCEKRMDVLKQGLDMDWQLYVNPDADLNLLDEKEKLLASNTGKREKVMEELQALEKNIAEYTGRLEKFRENERQLLENPFFEKYLVYPRDLVNGLMQAIRQSCQQHEIAHPEDQSLLVRRCLHSVDAIQFPFCEEDEKSEDDSVAFWQDRYFQLCGWLWSLQERLKKEITGLNPGHTDFLRTIDGLMSPHFAKSTAAIAAFQALGWQDLFWESSDFFLEKEKERYEDARHDLQDMLDKYRNRDTNTQAMCAAGADLIYSFESARKRDENHFDIKFSVTLLRSAQALIEQCTNERVMVEFKRLLSRIHDGVPVAHCHVGGFRAMTGGLLCAAFGTAIATMGREEFVTAGKMMIATGVPVGVAGFFGWRKGVPHGIYQAAQALLQRAEQVANQGGIDEFTPLAGQHSLTMV